MSDSRTFSNDPSFAAEQGRKGGSNQPDEIYKRAYTLIFATDFPR